MAWLLYLKIYMAVAVCAASLWWHRETRCLLVGWLCLRVHGVQACATENPVCKPAPGSRHSSGNLKISPVGPEAAEQFQAICVCTGPPVIANLEAGCVCLKQRVCRVPELPEHLSSCSDT